MSQQTLPVQLLPLQTFQATLGAQNCQITLQQMRTGLYASLSLSGSLVIAGKRCVDRVNLVRAAYLGFSGFLYFVDTTNQGKNPYYSGLGSRYILVYESPS